MAIRHKAGTSNGRFPASRFIIDPKVQRSLIPSRVKKLAADIKPAGIGVVTASQRGDGSLVLLDGQHRVSALIEAGMSDHPVETHVHKGLSLAEEADLFRTLNNTRAACAYDDFTKGVVAGDPESVEIDRIIRSHGLKVADQMRDGSVRAIAAIRKVYREDPKALDRALTIALGAWGPTIEATDGPIIAGLGIVALTYNGDLDDEALTKKLAKYPGGPARLVGSARGLREYRAGTVATLVATVIVDTYNHGRRNKLDSI